MSTIEVLKKNLQFIAENGTTQTVRMATEASPDYKPTAEVVLDEHLQYLVECMDGAMEEQGYSKAAADLMLVHLRKRIDERLKYGFWTYDLPDETEE